MSSKKRKIQSLNESLPLFPTNFKHFKYSNEPAMFSKIIQVETKNLREVQNCNFEKQQLQIKQMLQKINKLETQVKFQSKIIGNLERIFKNIENDKEMLDLAKDVESKLNLPESEQNKSNSNKESKTTEEFSYIS